MGVAREKSQHFRYRPGQPAFAGDLLREFLQLLRVRQLSIEQQISDLLESGLLGHPMNVVAPIHQPGSGIDPADRRLTGDYPGQSRAVLWFCFSTHVFADCNYDTRADKSSVALARPSLCRWIVVEQFVKLLARLHLIEPFLLGPAFFESTQKLLARLHRNAECALGENHHAVA